MSLRKDDVATEDVACDGEMAQRACVHRELNYLCHVAGRRRHHNLCFQVAVVKNGNGRSSSEEKVSFF